MRRGGQGAGRGGERTRDEGKGVERTAIGIFKFSLVKPMRLSDSHIISKRVKMTLYHIIVV